MNRFTPAFRCCPFSEHTESLFVSFAIPLLEDNLPRFACALLVSINRPRFIVAIPWFDEKLENPLMWSLNWSAAIPDAHPGEPRKHHPVSPVFETFAPPRGLFVGRILHVLIHIVLVQNSFADVGEYR
jgi:hypothetical protein